MVEGYDLPDVDMEEVEEDDEDRFNSTMQAYMDKDDLDDDEDGYDFSSTQADEYGLAQDEFSGHDNMIPQHDNKLVEEIGWDDDVQPFRGFNEDKEKPLLDKVEQESAILFDLLQEIEKEEVINAVSVITAVNRGGPINIPPSLLATTNGTIPKLRIVRAPGQELTIQEMLKILQNPFGAGWKRELIYNCVSDTKADIVQYISPDGTELRSIEEVIDYLENIYGISESDGGLGEKNFTFYRSPLTTLGDNSGELVYVIDPKTGGKTLVNLRRRKSPASWKTNHLQKRFPVNENVMPVKPFKRPRIPGQEAMMMRQGTFSPVRRQMRPGQMQNYNFNSTSLVENDPRTGRPVRRQRVRRPNMSMAAALGDQEEEDGMFQISALHQANPMLVSGLQEQHDKYQREREQYQKQQFRNSVDRNSLKSQHGSGEVLPCSIRCPGMPGQVPTLQCTRCLCLYHAECLGIPSNLNYVNFICANCESKTSMDTDDSLGISPTKTGMRPRPPMPIDKRNQLNKQQIEQPDSRNTRRIGQTVIAPDFQPIGKGGMSVKRMDIKPYELPLTRSRESGVSVRGRWAPPTKGRLGAPTKYPPIPFPQLSSGGKSLTIPPISKLAKGRAPPLPNLHPMLPNNHHGKSILPGRGNFNFRGLAGKGGLRFPPPLPDFGGRVKPNLVLQNRSGTQQNRSSARALEAFIKQNHPSGPSFRRYPQSVIALGPKKFIAIPCGQPKNNSPNSTPHTESVVADNGSNQGLSKDVKGFHSEPSVIGKVFTYLSVQDLLSASLVNTTWNKIASNKDLWKIVRMKNARVFDFVSFVHFLNKHETEIIDLRKMMNEGNTDWQMLIESLGKVPTLRNVVLGPRSSSAMHLELLNKYCPNIQITTQ